MSIHIGSMPFVAKITLVEKVIGNILGFLLQGRIRYSGVDKHTLIVTKNEGRKDARNPHHTKLFLQATNVFNKLFHRNEIGPK